MEIERALLASGTILLTASALLGLVQYKHRGRESFVRWRVVHVGGTAGAVQLLTLSALWTRFHTSGNWGALLAAGLILSTWAFFLGPLAAALDRTRAARAVNITGAALAVPSYLALPLVLL